VLSPSAPQPLSPVPFPFDHPPQGLMAGRAAKPLTGAATGAYKPHLAPRTLAAKKFQFMCWALTLAGLRRTRTGGFQRLRERCLGFCCLPTKRASASIPLALSLAFHSTMRGLAVLPAGPPAPPSPSRGTALGAAISGLGPGRAKGLLASLEQTRSLTRPASPLTGPRLAASWYWAQGSCELPTAKPRMRSSYLRSEAPFRSRQPSWPIPTIQLKADTADLQAVPRGPPHRNSEISDWSPSHRKSGALEDRYRHSRKMSGS
jgi:hypothetical protein